MGPFFDMILMKCLSKCLYFMKPSMSRKIFGWVPICLFSAAWHNLYRLDVILSNREGGILLLLSKSNIFLRRFYEIIVSLSYFCILNRKCLVNFISFLLHRDVFLVFSFICNSCMILGGFECDILGMWNWTIIFW